MIFENFKHTETHSIIKYLVNSGILVLFTDETAENIYRNMDFSTISIVTNASRVELAAQFDDIKFQGDSIIDAETTAEGLKINFSLYPPADISLEKWLKPDSLKRIFRSSAIYFDPSSENFYDPFSGIPDLKNNALKLIEGSEGFLINEPVPFFRSIFSACSKGIMPDESYISLIEKVKFDAESLVLNNQLVREIFKKILTSQKPYIGIYLMSKSGILDNLLPEIAALKKVPHEKDFHPEGNAYEHTIECFKHIEKPSLELAFAILLHDVGKSKTMQGVKSEFKFPQHASIGAIIAVKILQRLKFPQSTIAAVEELIKNHMIPSSIPDMPIFRTKSILDSKLFPDLLKLYWADLSSSYNPPDMYLRTKAFYEDYLKQRSVYEKYGVKKRIN